MRSLHALVRALLLLSDVMTQGVWGDARSAALRNVRTYARFGRLSSQQQVTALSAAGEHGFTSGSAQTNRPVPVTELAAAKEGGGTYKVHVKVYLESKCPACRSDSVLCVNAGLLFTRVES